ncbi:unnamed protein product [Lupinus luteus]|uniref:Thymidylate synthase/dCMP hydroxymethylase domain-containing protein n=1 Tax=Lupinus luteus TaxID=3873 RepID=A0AAV1YKA6_LUPLU
MNNRNHTLKWLSCHLYLFDILQTQPPSLRRRSSSHHDSTSLSTTLAPLCLSSTTAPFSVPLKSKLALNHHTRARLGFLILPNRQGRVSSSSQWLASFSQIQLQLLDPTSIFHHSSPFIAQIPFLHSSGLYEKYSLFLGQDNVKQCRVDCSSCIFVAQKTLNAPGCEAAHITEIEASIECDTFMPQIDTSIFQLWYSSFPLVENNIRYSFNTYVRVKSCPIESLSRNNDPSFYNATNEIKHNHDDRRTIISWWNPSDLKLMALPSCHMFAQPLQKKSIHGKKYQFAWRDKG